jgi:hypothetical protein
MNRTQILCVAMALIIAGSFSSEATAADISIQPVVAGFFDPITFVPLPPIYPGPNPGFPVVVQVDVTMQVLSLAPGEDSFGLAGFSFDLSGNSPGELVPDPDAGGWSPSPLGFLPPPPSPGINLPAIAYNEDSGVSSTDLKGILAFLATGPFNNPNDPRRNVGELGSIWPVPFVLGSAFLEWNGLGEVSFTLDPVQVGAKLVNGDFVSAIAAPVAVITLGSDVPEPSSVVMLGGMLAVAGLRRRR